MTTPFSEPRRGSYLRGCFTALVSLLLLLVVVGGFLGWWAFWRPRPQVDGSIRVAGLQAPVEVLRDEWGVPHIYAQNEHDLFFAQGYVHAQDRLWQMDLQRRIGMARLSEIFGEDGLETDRFLRTIGTNRAARADVANLDPQSLTLLAAYAAGVNAFVDSHRGNLPIEFRILRYSPEQWQPADTAAWAKMMQWSLSSNWEDELFRARLVAELGESQAADLMALYPEGAPLILPEGVDAYSRLGAPRVAAARMLGDLGFGSGDSLGSNNWVVSGAKSATGRPILANDPHLGIRMPSIWYEIGLHAPGLNAVGASLPGIPALVIGHNDHIAWGMTTLQVDVQDLYIERLNPDNPAEYEVDGRFEPFDIVREEIHVSGRAEPEILEVRVGRHGPLINDVLEGAERPTAFRWLGVAEPSTLLATIGPLIRASTWEEFTAALETWDAPGQNFVYADDQGNIGYYGAARVPIRAQGTGDVPAPGWDGSHDWEGFIPFEEMPHAFNPPEGFIATANNKPVPDDYPFHLGSAWAAPYRQQRIVTLLTAKDKLSLEDMRAIQADIVSLPARTLVPALLSVASEDIIVQRAQEQLRDWHEIARDRMEPGLPGAGIYEATYLALLQRLFGDELGPELLDDYLGRSSFHHVAVANLLSDPDATWWDDQGTPERESRDDVLAAALVDMTEQLGRQYGDVPHEWWWRRLHPAVFAHQLGGVAPLHLIFNRTLPEVAGSGQTPLATGLRYGEDFVVTGLPSYRQIVDVGAWENSLFHHTTGQSGLPFDPHYDDMIVPWGMVQLHSMRFSRQEVESASQGRILVLEPAP